jgi:hypothetical protein
MTRTANERDHEQLRAGLVFISGSCENTPVMRANLDAALQALGWSMAYQVETWPRPGVWAGYPSPTVLFRNRDLFGMPDPVPPFPEEPT